MKKLRIITCLLLIILLVNITNFTFAKKLGSYGDKSIGGLDVEDYKPGDLTDGDTEKPFKVVGNIVSALVVVGIAVAIVMFIVLGIKYMIGSVEEKADYKKTMMPMIIGTVLIFMTSSIVGIIFNLVNEGIQN